MDYINKFKSRLKQLRDEKKLSQTELADIVGISRGSISFYEKGERQPDIETVYKMAQYFNVTSDYLLGLTNGRTHINADINKTIGLEEFAIKKLTQYNHDPFGDNVEIRTLNTIIQDTDLLWLITCYLYTRKESGISIVTDKGRLDDVSDITLGLFTDINKDITADEQAQTIEWHIQDSIEHIQLQKVMECLKSIREKELIKYIEFLQKREDLQAGDTDVTE